jgi:hypothetical protein
MLLLPVFALFKIKRVEQFRKNLAALFSKPFFTALLSLPLMGWFIAYFIRYPEQQNLVEDWFLFMFSITLLFYGYLLGSSTRFWETCEKYRKYFLCTAAVCVGILYYEYWWDFALPTEQNGRLYAYAILNSVHIWSLILAILGFAKKHLNFSNSFLRYTNKAVYPYYILHQTAIVVFGYYVVQWQLPIFIKLALLIIACFLTIGILYNWVIKPFILTRILYGLKPTDKNVPAGRSGN